MGSKYLEFPSAGALGCITASFTAGTGWRRRKTKNAAFNCNVEMYLNLLWKFLKPVSFSLIGKEVDFQVLTGSVLLYGFLTLLIGVVFRLVSGYLSFCGGNMNWKEKAYITLSGFPKATGKAENSLSFVRCQKISFLFSWTKKNIKSVQAALGPVALDLARSQNADEEKHLLAQNVLVISVLAIISTAPLGKRKKNEKK
jgi:solute carrier family 9B (sodium/hydrogen exchanger), member 1/2